MNGTYERIAEHIGEQVGAPFTPRERRALGGGCINRCLKFADGDQRYFVKINHAALHDMFAAEAAGLRLMAASGALRVPAPVCWGVADDSAYLVLEFVEMHRPPDGAMGALGAGLARLHGVTSATFGWEMGNYIGSTPQINTPETDWVTFFRERRLRYQLELAANNGFSNRALGAGERLLHEFTALFATYAPKPALLHGDLWGGNVSTDANGHPVVYDPAVYFGDREADLAMTELFGGFGEGFYRVYNEHRPLDPGYAARKSLYNLYHVLNHFNLFGGGYATQAENLIRRILAELN